jgi:hypothetical protein
VKDLFEEAEAAEEQKDKEQIFDEIKTELETHARIEETKRSFTRLWKNTGN